MGRPPVIPDVFSASNPSADVSKSFSLESEGEGCNVKCYFDQEVTLIVPLPSYGQTVTRRVGVDDDRAADGDGFSRDAGSAPDR